MSPFLLKESKTTHPVLKRDWGYWQLPNGSVTAITKPHGITRRASATLWRLKQERENANIMTTEIEMRICAAVGALTAPTDEERQMSLADPSHPVWALQDKEEVSRCFDLVLKVVPKATDLPLSEYGRGSASAELIRKATSGVRAQARVVATFAAALLAPYKWGWRGADLAPSRALTALALLVDRLGQGGPRGLGLGSSHRDGAFACLGSGRRQANDGAAWDAALSSAIESLGGSILLAEDPTREVGDPLRNIVVHHKHWVHGDEEVLLSVEDLLSAAEKIWGAKVLVPLLGRSLLSQLRVEFEGCPSPTLGWWEVELASSTVSELFDRYAGVRAFVPDTANEW